MPEKILLSLPKLEIRWRQFIMSLFSNIYLGDSKDILKEIKDNSVDLIFTSPPYADRRKNTYGGIHPNHYVEWFLPISKELYQVLKPTGCSKEI